MRTVIVKDPNGTAWRVRVVWELRWHALVRRYGGWRRRKERRQDSGDLPDFGSIDTSGEDHHTVRGKRLFDIGDDILLGVVVIIGLIVFGLLFWWLLLPLLLLILDVVAVVVLVVAGVLSRILFRRPWKVRATSVPGTASVMTAVVGWRAALQTRDEMADKLRLGHPQLEIITEGAAGLSEQ